MLNGIECPCVCISLYYVSFHEEHTETNMRRRTLWYGVVLFWAERNIERPSHWNVWLSFYPCGYWIFIPRSMCIKATHYMTHNRTHIPREARSIFLFRYISLPIFKLKEIYRFSQAAERKGAFQLQTVCSCTKINGVQTSDSTCDLLFSLFYTITPFFTEKYQFHAQDFTNLQ